MEPWHLDDQATIYHGDCLDILQQLPDASVDSVVTDPPYGLEFMGKEWDRFNQDNGWRRRVKEESDDPNKDWGVFNRTASRSPHLFVAGSGFQLWCQKWAAECLRVLKPGGHLLAFGGTRTWHRLAVAIEDAGFEIRDSIAWMYGSGFPKSLDVSKAIDKVNGEGGRLHKFTAWMRTTGLTARELNDATGTFMGSHYLTAKSQPAIPTPDLWALIRPLCGDVPAWVDQLVERIEAEREVVLQRKVSDRRGDGTVVGLGHSGDASITAPATPDAARWQGWGTALKPAHEPVVVARKPLTGTVAANVLEHGTGALNIDGCRIGTEVLTAQARGVSRIGTFENADGNVTPERTGRWPANVVLDEDQAAALDKQSGNRPGFATQRDRKDDKPAGSFLGTRTGPALAGVVREGYNDTGGASRFFYVAKAPGRERPKVDGIAHPTVKPLTLMRWLCRLVTPPGGVVLEPFAGSGTTIEAALMEGLRVVAIEREPDYLPLIAARLERVNQEPDDGQLTFDASA